MWKHPDEEDELAIPSAEVMPVMYVFITDRVPPDQRKHGRREKTKLAWERNGGKGESYT